MTNYIFNITNNTGLKVLCILIVLDTIFGVLRSLKEHDINSTIGIDGVIRKVGMVISILFFIGIDILLNINLLGFLPEDVLKIINIDKIGLNYLFIILFIVFEFISILKNMILCKLPIPIKFQEFLEKIMKEFTGEIKK